MSFYLLDTTVLIGHLRGDAAVQSHVRRIAARGHTIGTTCVNLAEVERGFRPREERSARRMLDRLVFLPTTREAAHRAGRYQADFGRRGRTIHTADALIAGTARVHGAILVTDNLKDFPMRDIRVERPPV